MLFSYLLPWSPILLPLIIAVAGLSSMLVHQWLKRGGSVLLPAYTLPFVLAGWALLLVAEPEAQASAPVQANALDALARGRGARSSCWTSRWPGC